MYTNHFFDRMNERVYNNDRKLNNKNKKIQKHHSKTIAKKALKNKIAEYKDLYGYKYIYYIYNRICYKFVYQKNKILTVYEVDFTKEKNKFNLNIYDNRMVYYE